MSNSLSDSTNYTTDRTPSTPGKYNAVFTDKKNNSDTLASDFLTLMVAQLKNQDFMNPMDDTQYVTQMAQFSMMQAMTEMSSNAKTSYAMSLIGKTVTASRYGVSGDLDTTTGTVDKISFVDNEYVLYIGNKKYSMEQIMEVAHPKEKGECAVDPSDITVLGTNTTTSTADISWKLPTEDETVLSGLGYQVYYSEEGPFNSVEAVEAGTRFGPQLKGITDEAKLTQSLANLAPGKTYYVNVVVTDANGNKAVYSPTSIRTKSS